PRRVGPRHAAQARPSPAASWTHRHDTPLPARPPPATSRAAAARHSGGMQRKTWNGWGTRADHAPNRRLERQAGARGASPLTPCALLVYVHAFRSWSSVVVGRSREDLPGAAR